MSCLGICRATSVVTPCSRVDGGCTAQLASVLEGIPRRWGWSLTVLSRDRGIQVASMAFIFTIAVRTGGT